MHFDLIIDNKTFDDTTCIAHFIHELIFFNWVYLLIDHKNKTLLSIFKDLINQCDRIKFNERAIICIIRINQKLFIDKKLEDWMRVQEINWDWSTKNIFEQNEKFERFDELLIEKTKCIKEHVKLSKDFYSECYLVAAHILNRTSSSSLSEDSSLIFMQKLFKESIRNEMTHLKMFNCKTFSFFKKTDALKRSEKMKSRAFIEYLIEYDFINIFRVWNSKKDDVNDYRDVIFNETKFFDTYKAIDLFKKEEKKFYVTYRAISLQIFENNDEKQYDRISIRKHVLNNFRKNVASKSMMMKKISSLIETFQLLTFDDTSSSESESASTINIFVAIEKSRRNVSMKNKKMISFFRKIKSLNKENNFFFERIIFFIFIHRIYQMIFSRLKKHFWTCWLRKILAFAFMKSTLSRNKEFENLRKILRARLESTKKWREFLYFTQQWWSFSAQKNQNS